MCRENRLANCTNDTLEQWSQAAQRAEVCFKKSNMVPSLRDFFELVDEEYCKALERPVPSINTPESPLTITLIILSVILPAMPMRGR